MISAGYNQPVPPEDDPAAMFKRVFGNGTTASDEQIQLALAQRKSVLDFVQDDFTRLQGKLGSHDRQKLEQHATAVRNLEQRLSRTTAMPGCAADSKLLTGEDPNDKSKFPELGRQQMDILALALQCDMTRVASLQWSWARSLLAFPWIGVEEGHHNITHQDASPKLSSINTWYAKQLVYLAKALDAVKEAEGKSVLDNSVVWWCGETARGYDHDFNNIRGFLVGSAGGQLKNGEHIVMKGEPHNKLLTHLMNLMGIPGDSFGGPFGTGALTGINVGT
jgi:translation initiation factor 1 (eIF-1/SUI1)